MHCTSVPQNLALALPGHRTTSDPTVETKDVPPSTGNKQAAFRNAPISKAFGACKVVRVFEKILRRLVGVIAAGMIGNVTSQGMRRAT